jgi:ASC-1-like (ASCH) protein
MSVKVLECCEPWFSLIKIGRKPVEGRRNSPLWASIVVGELVRFDNGPKGSADYDCFFARIMDIRRYPYASSSVDKAASAPSLEKKTSVPSLEKGDITPSPPLSPISSSSRHSFSTSSSSSTFSSSDPLTTYLLTETLARTLPGVATLEEGRQVYLRFWSAEAINKVGMLALHVRPMTSDDDTRRDSDKKTDSSHAKTQHVSRVTIAPTPTTLTQALCTSFKIGASNIMLTWFGDRTQVELKTIAEDMDIIRKCLPITLQFHAWCVLGRLDEIKEGRGIEARQCSLVEKGDVVHRALQAFHKKWHRRKVEEVEERKEDVSLHMTVNEMSKEEISKLDQCIVTDIVMQ